MELGNMLFGNSRGMYPIERSVEEDDFKTNELMLDFLDAVGCSGYGVSVDGHPFGNERGGVTCDTFIVRPYYWGDDEEIAKLPNFEYKSKGLEISWYKYALRDAYSNIELDYAKLKVLLANCLEEYKKECDEKNVGVVPYGVKDLTTDGYVFIPLNIDSDYSM